jgi:hypothetical protein
MDTTRPLPGRRLFREDDLLRRCFGEIGQRLTKRFSRNIELICLVGCASISCGEKTNVDSNSPLRRNAITIEPPLY